MSIVLQWYCNAINSLSWFLSQWASTMLQRLLSLFSLGICNTSWDQRCYQLLLFMLLRLLLIFVNHFPGLRLFFCSGYLQKSHAQSVIILLFLHRRWSSGHSSHRPRVSIGVQQFFFYSIFIWLTLFSLYFSILRTIYFLTFFDSRPPSFAKLTFCKFKLSNWPFFVRIFSED